ncbi:MAG: hypothetical protein LBP59_00120 [Planctomycetaceae bacterium]|jgi:hypothetical protein|nr:hypothetical protein [Planctomycetaceae bacterium]
MLNQKIIITVLSLLFVLFVAGCGSNVKVSGKVTFADGSPVEKGKVVFENNQYSFFGTIQKDGTFRLGRYKDGDGIVAGKYQVAVNSFTTSVGENLGPDTTYFVAEKFRSTKTSGIEFDIQQKTTDISIIVEPPKPNEKKPKKKPPIPLPTPPIKKK